MSGIVYLNVGGCYYVTMYATLAHSQSFFQGLVSQQTTEEQCIFVDRDPTHFRYILNWLRGVRELPDDETSLRELAWEADYYALPDMLSAIHKTQRHPSLSKSVHMIAHALEHV